MFMWKFELFSISWNWDGTRLAWHSDSRCGHFSSFFSSPFCVKRVTHATHIHSVTTKPHWKMMKNNNNILIVQLVNSLTDDYRIWCVLYKYNENLTFSFSRFYFMDQVKVTRKPPQEIHSTAAAAVAAAASWMWLPF